MKKNLVFILLLCASFTALSANNRKPKKQSIAAQVPVISSTVDSMSHALGMVVGTDFSDNFKTIPGGEVNIDLFLDAFSRAIKNDSVGFIFSTEAAFEYYQNYMTDQLQKASEANISKNTNFLTENAKRPEVKTTESGLQYEIIYLGEGQMPNAQNTVKVDYEGFLIDGTKFDSSLERGEPAVFGVSQVIKGWTEGLQLMPAGSEFKFYIPSDLAYGDRDMNPIPANSTLIFTVKLLEIVQ